MVRQANLDQHRVPPKLEEMLGDELCWPRESTRLASALAQEQHGGAAPPPRRDEPPRPFLLLIITIVPGRLPRRLHEERAGEVVKVLQSPPSCRSSRCRRRSRRSSSSSTTTSPSCSPSSLSCSLSTPCRHHLSRDALCSAPRRASRVRRCQNYVDGAEDGGATVWIRVVR